MANTPETAAADDSVATRFLNQLAAHGVLHLYVNAGTDFAPVVEAYAQKRSHDGQPTHPEPVVCAHENLAVGMAHGAWLTTGNVQAVMFHVSVGTANAICAVTNAARDNVPLLVAAGRTPILETGALGARDTSIHWAQEMFDQAGMLRELVKWDYELKDARQIEAVVDRAFAIASMEPRGPVYLSLPREILAQTHDTSAVSLSQIGPNQHTAVPRGSAPDPAAVRKLVDALSDAQFPVLATSASGADPQSVALLAELAERFDIGIAEIAPRYMNVGSHPLHLGGNMQKIFDAADALLFLECDVPWMPMRFAPREDTFIAQAGTDPLYVRYPMRSHRSDLTLAGSPSLILRALIEEFSKRAPQSKDRRSRLLDWANAERDTLEALKRNERNAEGPISKNLIALTLGEALDADTVVFNEYWGMPELLGRKRPRTYFYLPPSGGLGWALPAALGAKKASPERTCVALVGDGTYLFSNPAACHHAAAKHELPVLTIVANNARWGAVDHATASVYPQGLAVATGEARWSDLSPLPAFEAYCEASGGYGERVIRREDLKGAILRALKEVAAGRQALLNVECS